MVVVRVCNKLRQLKESKQKKTTIIRRRGDLRMDAEQSRHVYIYMAGNERDAPVSLWRGVAEVGGRMPMPMPCGRR